MSNDLDTLQGLIARNFEERCQEGWQKLCVEGGEVMTDDLEAIRELLAADINDWREMEAHRKVRDLLRLLDEANNAKKRAIKTHRSCIRDLKAAQVRIVKAENAEAEEQSRANALQRRIADLEAQLDDLKRQVPPEYFLK